MIVYHGSVEVVKEPEVRMPNRPLDFGEGFYTTSSFEQAEIWTRRRMKENHRDRGYVNVFEIEELHLNQLRWMHFDSPTDEWIDFVMANRMHRDFHHDFDVVSGPVANDRVYFAFTLYEGDMIDRDELIRRLKTYTLVDQYLFHTPESLKLLNYLESKEVLL